MKNKQLGYDKAQTIIVPITNNDFYRHLESFRNDLLAEHNISAVSIMSGEPGGFFDGQMFEVEGKSERWKARTEFSDFEFVKILGLKIIAGRNFSSDYPTDTMQAVLINRTAAANLGWTPEQALGKSIRNTVRDSISRKVIGVIEDYNFLSLREHMDPLVISPAEDTRVALIKLKPG